MTIHELGRSNSLAAQYLSELRDVSIQGDRMRFRINLERLGSIFAYEISKELSWEEKEIITPLGTAKGIALETQPVIAIILRAGLAMHSGVLNFFDYADNAFISAYRKHDNEGAFEIKIEYISCPDINGRVIILSDPMLATGASMVLAIEALRQIGEPKHIHIVTAIACKDGVDYVRRNATNTTLWTVAVDDELTAKAYIVPGLGDVGDLAYGPKMQE